MPSALDCALAPLHARRYISWFCLRGGAMHHRNKCAAALHIKRFVGEIRPRDEALGSRWLSHSSSLFRFHGLLAPWWFLLLLCSVFLYAALTVYTPLPPRASGTRYSSYTLASLAKLPVDHVYFHQVVWQKRLTGTLSEVKPTDGVRINLSKLFLYILAWTMRL